MSALRYLILSGNKFSNFPVVLCELGNLQTLVLAKNDLVEIPPLPNLTELRELELFMNKVERLDFRTSLPKLATLSVRANRLTEVPAGLTSLSALTHLDISNNEIASLYALSKVENLTKLECAGCKLHSLSIFCQPNLSLCVKLAYLNVANNDELSSIPDLQLPQLIQLRASACSIDRVAPLEQCTSLRVLDLDSNPLRQRPMLKAPVLEQIGVCNTKLNELPQLDASMKEIAAAGARLTSLPEALQASVRRLYLQDNRLESVSMHFLESMPELLELSLQFNELTSMPSPPPESLFGSTLVVLDLSGNQIRSLPATFFKNMANLSQLNLSDNMIDVLPPNLYNSSRKLVFLNLFSNKLRYLQPEIGNLPKLRELYVGNNNLTEVPVEIGLLAELRILHLAGNSLTGVHFELPNLEKLYIGRNALREFPNSVSKCSRLDTLDLSGNQMTAVYIDGVLPHLQELILSHNSIESFTTSQDAKHTLCVLVSLDLSNNPMSMVPAVGTIETLEIVNLLHCNITQLSQTEMEEFSRISLIYMQGNPIEKLNKNRPLRISFVERNTDLLMSDLYKTANTIAYVPKLRNSSQDSLSFRNEDVDDESVAEEQAPLVSWSEIKGARTTQEDAMTVRSDLDGAELQHLYAVFDGHRGSEVSKMCAVQFPILLRANLANPMHSTLAALERTFETLSQSISRANMSDGATAGVALIQKERIAMAHLGDARVVLYSQVPSDEKSYEDEDASTSSTSSLIGNPSSFRHLTMRVYQNKLTGQTVRIVATMDHTAKNRVERRRVERELHGYVSDQGHVMGDCAVTRAFGDFQFSPYVSSKPSILLLPRTGLEMFMIVACDGFWDTTTNEKAHNIVFAHLNDGGSPDTCALLLRDYALSMGSQGKAHNLVSFIFHFFDHCSHGRQYFGLVHHIFARFVRTAEIEAL